MSEHSQEPQNRPTGDQPADQRHLSVPSPAQQNHLSTKQTHELLSHWVCVCLVCGILWQITLTHIDFIHWTVYSGRILLSTLHVLAHLTILFAFFRSRTWGKENVWLAQGCIVCLLKESRLELRQSGSRTHVLWSYSMVLFCYCLRWIISLLLKLSIDLTGEQFPGPTFLTPGWPLRKEAREGMSRGEDLLPNHFRCMTWGQQVNFSPLYLE